MTALSQTIADAKAGQVQRVAMFDTESDPGSYADALAHSPCLRVEEYAADGEA